MSNTKQPVKERKVKKPTKDELAKIKAVIVAAKLKDKDTDFLAKLCSLYEQGVYHITAVFFGSGDSGDLYDIRFTSSDGLSDVFVDRDAASYADIRDELYELFSENVTVDWVNNEGGGGELTIELPSFKVNVTSFYNEITRVPEDDIDITLSALEGVKEEE